MKRQEIENHTRAAFYLKCRAGAYVGVTGGHYVGTWQPKEKGHFYCESPDDLLRNVVKAHEADHSLDNRGYYDNPFGESSRHDDSGLVFGMVAQLPGKRGQCRYVAGYRYGSSDIGATFDMGRIFEAPGEDHESARHDAARYADSMAESAAEKERDYQTASQAGFQWAELGAEIEQERQEALALLKERRAARAAMGQEYPATCKALRGAIRAAWRSIQEKRQERRELALGNQEPLFWSWGRNDETGLSAFAESAGLSTEAARKICS